MSASENKWLAKTSDIVVDQFAGHNGEDLSTTLASLASTGCVTPDRVIIIDSTLTQTIEGKAYSTFAAAKTYIESAASGTKFAVHLPAGIFSEAIVLMPDVEIAGANTVLTGNLSSSVTSDPELPSLSGCTVNSNIIPDNGKVFSISHCHWAPASYYPSGVTTSTSVIKVSSSSVGSGSHSLGPVSVAMDHCTVNGTFSGTTIEFSESDLDNVTMGVTTVVINDSSVTGSSLSSVSLTAHSSRFSGLTGLTPNGAYAFYSCEFTDLPNITGSSASMLFDHCKVNVVPSGSSSTTRTFSSCPMTFKNESILDTSNITAITFSDNTTPLNLDCTSTAYDASGDFESKITYSSNTPSVSIEKKIAVRYSTYPNGYDLNNDPAMTTTDQSQSYAGLFSTNRGADPNNPSNYVWFNRGAGINGAVMYHKIYVDTTKITNVQEGMFSTYKEAWDHLIAFREAEWATAHGAQQGTAWDPTYDYEPWRIELQSGTLKNPTGSNVNDVLMERNVEIHGNNTLLDVPIVPATIWFAKGVDVSALVDSQTGLPTPFAQIMTSMKNIGAYMYTTYATSLQRSKITGCTITMIDIDRRYDIEGVNGMLGDDFDFTTSTATYMTGTINAFTFASCLMDCSVILKPDGFKYDKMYDSVNTMSLKIIANPAVAAQLFSDTTAGQLVEGLLFYANNYVFFTEHAAIHTDLDFTCNTILGLYNDFIVCPQEYAEDLVTGASGWYKPFKISGLMVKSCNTRFLSVPYTTNDVKLAGYAAHQPLFYQAFNIDVSSYSSSFSSGTFYDSDYVVNSMRIATLAGATFYDCVFESFGSMILGFDTIQMFKPFTRDYTDPESGNTFKLFANLFEVDRFNWALRQTNYNLQSEGSTFYDAGDPSNGVYPLKYFPETGNIFMRFSDFTLSTLAGSTSTQTYGLVYGILSFADQLLKTILTTVNEVSFQNCTLDLYRAGFRLARIGTEYTTYISNLRTSVASGNALKSYKIPFKEKIANETWSNSTDANDRVLISLADCSNSNRYKAAYSTSSSTQTYLATSARYFQADKAMLVVSGDELKVYNNTVSPGAPTGTTTGTLPAAIASGISKENRSSAPSF